MCNFRYLIAPHVEFVICDGLERKEVTKMRRQKSRWDYWFSQCDIKFKSDGRIIFYLDVNPSDESVSTLIRFMSSEFISFSCNLVCIMSLPVVRAHFFCCSLKGDVDLRMINELAWRVERVCNILQLAQLRTYPCTNISFLSRVDLVAAYMSAWFHCLISRTDPLAQAPVLLVLQKEKFVWWKK